MVCERRERNHSDPKTDMSKTQKKKWSRMKSNYFLAFLRQLNIEETRSKTAETRRTFKTSDISGPEICLNMLWNPFKTLELLHLKMNCFCLSETCQILSGCSVSFLSLGTLYHHSIDQVALGRKGQWPLARIGHEISLRLSNGSIVNHVIDPGLPVCSFFTIIRTNILHCKWQSK